MTQMSPLDLVRAQRIWWPWAMVLVVLLGTGASNADAQIPHSVIPGVLLAVLSALPAVFPRLLSTLGMPTAGGLLVSGALLGGYFAAGYADGPVFVTLPAVAFVVASQTSVRAWVSWAVAGVAASWLGLVGRYAWWDPTPEKHVWQAIGILGVVAACGAIATAVRSRMETRAVRVERTAAEERLWMAQDLHDGVGHGLAVAAMQAGVALHLLERDPAKARASLEATRATIQESLGVLRAELARMSGDAPHRPGRGMGDLPLLLERIRAAGMRLEVRDSAGDVAERVGAVVYAVVQEALTNVLRHANAECATVTFERVHDTTLVVTIADDGRGRAEGTSSGLGLDGMRSRVERLGGTLEAGAADVGFRVRAELPLHGEDVGR